MRQEPILILHPRLQAAEALASCLEDGGFENLTVETDFDHCLQHCLHTAPSLVLLSLDQSTQAAVDLLHLLQLDDRLSNFTVLGICGAGEARLREKSAELGVSEFLPPDLDDVTFRLRVTAALQLFALQRRVVAQQEELEERVRQRTEELVASRQEVVHCLARAGEYRDDDTGQHVIRVGKYVGVIAKELGYSPDQVEILELAAKLHDMGKIAIPDAILHKPEKLTVDEYELIQRHCGIGGRIMQAAAEGDLQLLRKHSRIGADLLHVPRSPLLMLASKIAQTHHEKWDGTGYPLGLAGEDIPIEGRMTAIADVYDALSSKRPYKPPFSRKKCFEILEEGRGTHFDPAILDAFFRRSQEIISIQLEYMDI